MTAATTPLIPEAPAPLEIPGPVARVPSLEEVYRLTEVPDRRVVFGGVDWPFYEQLVDSIPAGSHIHVDYDGRDLEVTGLGPKHEMINRRLDRLIGIIAREWHVPFAGMEQTTWKRREVSRGLESDQSYYFLAEKRAQRAEAWGPERRLGLGDVGASGGPPETRGVPVAWADPPIAGRASVAADHRIIGNP